MARTIDELVSAARRTIPTLDEARLRAAYAFAERAHVGQLRKSGELYIQHPLNAALHLTDLGVDEDTLVACLLHDVPEDTPSTLEDIAAAFGEDVATLVGGITKLTLVYYKNDMEARQVESLRRMFLVMASDLRVVLIKLADRLHNMETLHWVDPEKRVRIARETLEIYAPLADRLGIFQFKWRLEDLCFKHLYPLEEAALRRSLTEGQSEREAYIARVEKLLVAALTRAGVAGVEVEGRTKHLYSIFLKMQRKQKTLAEIYDLFALRVILQSTPECYAVLGVIHELWKPVPGRFKDYVAAPKLNGYQSLHTTVFCLDERLTEFQIRTRDMHRESEYGTPAHWFYNQQKAEGSPGKVKAPSSWVQRIVELSETSSSSTEFVESLKFDLFEDRIFVFTPRGDVKDLPKGATALDFAYAIHSNIGHRAQGVRVNGSIAPLVTPLKTGDVVEVMTGKISAPKRDWMKLVKTQQARTKIRTFLKTQDRAHNIAVGRGLLDRALELAGKGRADELSATRWRPVLDHLHVKTVDDVYASIGEGTSPTLPILKKLFKATELLTMLPAKRAPVAVPSSRPRVFIQGSGDYDVRLATCCSPKPPEKIVARITKTKGITVHCLDCHALRSAAPDRLIHATWEAPSGEEYRYSATLELTVVERPGAARDLLQTVSSADVTVLRLEVLVRSPEETTELLTVEVSSIDALSRLFDALERTPGVKSIRRKS